LSGPGERPIANGSEKARRRVLVLYDPFQAGITAHVRGFHFQRPLGERGWRMDFEEYTPPPASSPRRPARECAIALRARRYDIVYLLKVSSLSLVRRLKAIACVPVVFDLTDSLWRKEVGGSVWGDLDAILGQSDAVFTCNTYDTGYGARFNRAAVCLPSYADVTEFERVRAGRPPRAGGPLRIGWVGSPSTVQGIRNVAEALDRVAEKAPGLTLRVVGCREPADLPAFRFLSVSLGPAAYDQATMIEEILDMDAGIYPVVLDEEDYCIRGPLKALNYMAGKVPCVAHRAGEVARLIEDGRNGMLASSPEEWESKLERLLRDPELRREMGAAGLATVRASSSFEGAVAGLEAAFAATLEAARTSARPRSPLTASVRILDQLARAGVETARNVLGRGRRGR
jgi:glycosyltransferase involved in cell wall biosynthesis